MFRLVSQLLAMFMLVPVVGYTADFAIIPKVGTNGYGIEAAFGKPSVQLRAGVGKGSYDRQVSEGQLDYDGTLELSNYSAMLDFYPGGRSFRLSVGAVANDNRIDLLATGTGTYVLDGVSYDISSVGNITGDVTFNSFSPYVGIGFGNPLGSSRRVGVTLDIGAMYQGEPKLHLQANPTNPAVLPPGFNDHLEAERAATEAEMSEYKYYPVVALGLVIRF